MTAVPPSAELVALSVGMTFGRARWEAVGAWDARRSPDPIIAKRQAAGMMRGDGGRTESRDENERVRERHRAWP